MSKEAIANALLPTCESTIKTLSQLLATLHSIDALDRLKEKADVVEAFLAIASFAHLLAPSDPPAAPATAEESVEEFCERMEREAEESLRNGLSGLGRHDETTVFSHPSVLAPSSTSQDGRDEILPSEALLPSSQSVSGTSHQRVVPLEHLIHPERQSDLTPFARKEKPLYSFLLHFPVFSAVEAKLSIVDRAELSLFSAIEKWGLGNLMTTLPYPRLRLTNRGAACIVVDDDLRRLEEIRKDLEKAQRELWDKSAAGMLDRTFFLVGTWQEEHVSLVFSLDHGVENGEKLGDFERWTAPGNLWKDILEIYPILSHYQELVHGQEGVRPLLGARILYRQQRYKWNAQVNYHRLTLIVPLLWSPHAHIFANDFIAQYSSISLVSNGGTNYKAGVRAVKMGPPPLKGREHWDGPVLLNVEWQGGVDDSFGPKCYL